MKKIILSAAILAGLAFVSCSKDDDKDNNNDSNCVTCDAVTAQGFTIPEERVCKGENGNAFVGSEDTEMSYEDYLRGQRLLRTCD